MARSTKILCFVVAVLIAVISGLSTHRWIPEIAYLISVTLGYFLLSATGNIIFAARKKTGLSFTDYVMTWTKIIVALSFGSGGLIAHHMGGEAMTASIIGMIVGVILAVDSNK